jgi:hypothetical protein
MMTAHVDALTSAGARVRCTLAFTTEPPWRLELRGLGEQPRVAAAPDLFESLAELRSTLEPSGTRLLCEGACRDVLPSPMSRQSGGGRFAYRVRLGEPARREALVDIFAPAEPERVSPVGEQRDFARLWLASLRRPPEP